MKKKLVSKENDGSFFIANPLYKVTLNGRKLNKIKVTLLEEHLPISAPRPWSHETKTLEPKRQFML
jgi:hypothetical protein